MKVVIEGIGEGKVTSGTMSPTLKQSIGFARVPKATGEQVTLEVRGKMLAAKVVKPCFVRKGEALV
jgi:aminomethyltransferase